MSLKSDEPSLGAQYGKIHVLENKVSHLQTELRIWRILSCSGNLMCYIFHPIIKRGRDFSRPLLYFAILFISASLSFTFDLL